MTIQNVTNDFIKLFNENCMDVFEQIPSNSVDMIFTDPPYKTSSRGNAGTTGGMFQSDINLKGQVFKYNNIDIEDYLPSLYRVLKDGGHCYIMTNHKNLIHFLNVIDTWKDTMNNEGFHFIKCLIWNKGNKITGQFYMNCFEYILFLRKGRGIGINNAGTPDILSIPNKKYKNTSGSNLHDTEKPVELTDTLILNSSKVGDIVFDPFMGLGGCGVSCKRFGRKFIGSELDQEYYNIGKK